MKDGEVVTVQEATPDLGPPHNSLGLKNKKRGKSRKDLNPLLVKQGQAVQPWRRLSVPRGALPTRTCRLQTQLKSRGRVLLVRFLFVLLFG